jgi:hypothetical protein
MAKGAFYFVCNLGAAPCDEIAGTGARTRLFLKLNDAAAATVNV